MIVGIGIDVVDLDRFQGTLDRYGERFFNRMYTHVEQEYCRQFSSPMEHYAARFAAKEAFLKAIGTGKSRNVRWKDIEIYNERSGKPNIRVFGNAEEIVARLGGKNIYVSLSHSRLVATAAVVIED